jgi:phospholipase D1/2
MREHVGVDVDALEEDQLISRKPLGAEDEIQKWDPDHEQNEGERGTAGVTKVKAVKARTRLMATVETGVSSGESVYELPLPLKTDPPPSLQSQRELVKMP